MPTIKKIQAIQILDSRGLPTVSCEITLNNDLSAIAMVPSGASTGSKEALELRDGNEEYHGKSVLKAVNNINGKIRKKLTGIDITNQDLIDRTMIDLDGTNDKSRIGANAILAVSLAAAHVGAKSQSMELHDYFNKLFENKTGKKAKQILPVPMLNILNGGEHADNNVDIQEFMIIPNGAKNFNTAIQWSSEIYWNLKKILKKKNMSTSVGDEGGFAPNLDSNEEALELIIEAIRKSKLIPGEQVSLALDCASSEFYKNGLYCLKGENRELNYLEFVRYLDKLVDKYPIISIEDGLDEEDIEGWVELTKVLGDKCQLVGDDLFVTNKEILEQGIKKKIANSILIKFNQIGTLTETIETIALANKYNYKSIISHRSGETEDTTIADLATGLGVGQIKTGAPCRSDRISKYNRLLWIESKNNSMDFGS
jgi:enolase